MLYDHSNGLVELPGQTLIWQGNLHSTHYISNIYSCYAGGYVPKDGPSPILVHSQAEVIVVAIFTIPGILSAFYFLLFTIYYRKNLNLYVLQL